MRSLSDTPRNALAVKSADEDTRHGQKAQKPQVDLCSDIPNGFPPAFQPAVYKPQKITSMPVILESNGRNRNGYCSRTFRKPDGVLERGSTEEVASVSGEKCPANFEAVLSRNKHTKGGHHLSNSLLDISKRFVGRLRLRKSKKCLSGGSGDPTASVESLDSLSASSNHRSISLLNLSAFRFARRSSKKFASVQTLNSVRDEFGLEGDSKKKKRVTWSDCSSGTSTPPEILHSMASVTVEEKDETRESLAEASSAQEVSLEVDKTLPSDQPGTTGDDETIPLSTPPESTYLYTSPSERASARNGASTPATPSTCLYTTPSERTSSTNGTASESTYLYTSPSERSTATSPASTYLYTSPSARTPSTNGTPTTIESPLPMTDLGNGTVLIVLRRGKDGLGFNIVGGRDTPHIAGDPGIFVSKIRVHGSAFNDGRIKPGDRILAVNDVPLTGKTHEDAVKVFAGTKTKLVKLIVETDAERRAVTQPNDLLRILAPSFYRESDPVSALTPKSSDSGKSVSFKMTTAEPQRMVVPSVATSSANGFGGLLSANSRGHGSNETYADIVGPPSGFVKSARMNATLEKLLKAGDEVTSKLEQETGVDDNMADVEEDDGGDDSSSTISCVPSTHSIIDDVPRTPKKPFNILDPASPSVLTEVLFVSVGLAALSVAFYVGYSYFKRH